MCTLPSLRGAATQRVWLRMTLSESPSAYYQIPWLVGSNKFCRGRRRRIVSNPQAVLKKEEKRRGGEAEYVVIIKYYKWMKLCDG